MDKIIQIITTADNRGFLEDTGHYLVERRLVACAQVLGPMLSIYHWKGKIEKTQEWILFMKSKESLYGAIEEAIKEKHPYEVPEIVAMPIENGLASYMKWITNETTALPLNPPGVKTNSSLL